MRKAMEAKRNNSRKRRAILDVICATKSHPNAENIYETVKPMFPEISLGTVYRNLGVLEADGEIITVGTVDGQARYDGRTDEHAHFICRGCGKVSDVEFDYDTNGLCTKAESAIGIHPDRCSLSFTGLCAECAAQT